MTRPTGRPPAVAVFEQFGVDDHAVEIGGIGNLDAAECADAVDLAPDGGNLHAFGNLDPLLDAVIVRHHEIAARPMRNSPTTVGARASGL
jgi:hypothetical protein